MTNEPAIGQAIVEHDRITIVRVRADSAQGLVEAALLEGRPARDAVLIKYLYQSINRLDDVIRADIGIGIWRGGTLDRDAFEG